MIKSSENIIPVVFLCEHPTREEIALLFSFHADDVIRKPLDAEILQARIKAIQNRYRPQNKKEVKIYLFGKFKFDFHRAIVLFAGIHRLCDGGGRVGIRRGDGPGQCRAQLRIRRYGLRGGQCL